MDFSALHETKLDSVKEEDSGMIDTQSAIAMSQEFAKLKKSE